MLKRLPKYDEMITSIACSLISNADLELPDGWRFQATGNCRGRCCHSDRTISIPLHAIRRKSTGFLVYYIAHELSHIYSGIDACHGKEFINWFMIICPVEFQHFEYYYKSLNAKRFGIAKNENTMNLLRKCDF